MSARTIMYFDTVSINGTILHLSERAEITKLGGVQLKPISVVTGGKPETFTQTDYSGINSEAEITVALNGKMISVASGAKKLRGENLIEFSSTSDDRTATMENASINYEVTGDSIKINAFGDPIEL